MTADAEKGGKYTQIHTFVGDYCVIKKNDLL
jgi:hypothetical protein